MHGEERKHPFSIQNQPISAHSNLYKVTDLGKGHQRLVGISLIRNRILKFYRSFHTKELPNTKGKKMTLWQGNPADMNLTRCLRLNITSGGTILYTSQSFTKNSTSHLWYSCQRCIQSAHEQPLDGLKLSNTLQNKKIQGHKKQSNIEELFQTEREQRHEK